MPHKFNAARRHKFDKVQYRVINWAEYNESLRQRGDLTIWVSEEAQTRIFNLMYELQTIQRPSASLLIGARAR